MNRLPLFLLVCLLAAARPAQGQFGNFADVPVEVNAEETHFESGVAVAQHHVLIRYGAVVIYCDYAQYNPDTRDVLVLGNVRIFREGRIFTGERAVYNLETKQLTAAEVQGSSPPFVFQAETLNSIGPNAYLAHGATLTTSDNSKPDYHFRARTMRIYPNDRVIMRDIVLYVGQTPIFWFPYMHQSLNKEQGFLIFPGYTSTLGDIVHSRYTFPLTEDVSGVLRLDYMSKRGFGMGLNLNWEGAEKINNWSRFTSYFISDASPGTNETNTVREPIGHTRYRVTFQERTYLTEDIYSTVNINLLSDPRFLQDFERNIFRRDPNPDNVVALTKWDENYTFTLTARRNLNQFFDGTERLPELALDVKRQPIFGQSGLFYEGETSGAYLRRMFGAGAIFPDYSTSRVDSFHQLVYPQELFGWLSLIPRAGVRGTFYSNSGGFVNNVQSVSLTDQNGNPAGFEDVISQRLQSKGATGRFVGDLGLESSFKLSRAFEGVQSRTWGLDGFRHVIEPYLDASLVYTTKNPDQLLQFDRVNPSSQLPAIGFPQFNSIDSISNMAVVQLGARNRFETRRDNYTFTWLEWNGFFNINIKRPEYERTFLATTQALGLNQKFDPNANLRNRVADPGAFSNVYNNIRWTPLPWVALALDSQLPLLDKGFEEVNTSINFMPQRDLQLTLAHRYISGNVYFENSNYLVVGAVYRINDNWGVTAEEAYEFNQGQLLSQRYEVHRDLSSWVATAGLVFNNNGAGRNDLQLELVFTLKDLPLVRLPILENANSLSGTSSGSGKNP